MNTARFAVGLSYRQSLPCVVAIVFCAVLASSPHAQAADKQQKLESLLRRSPGADANKDGKLSEDEAKAYLEAHPELRRNRQADAKNKAKNEADVEGEAPVSAQVLALYEAREFKGVQYRLLKPIDLEKNPNKKYPMVLSLYGAGSFEVQTAGRTFHAAGGDSGRWKTISWDLPRPHFTKADSGARLTDVLHHTDRIVLPFKTIRAFNALIAELARTEKNVEFIDLFPAFPDDKGQHRAELFVEDGATGPQCGFLPGLHRRRPTGTQELTPPRIRPISEIRGSHLPIRIDTVAAE